MLYTPSKCPEKVVITSPVLTFHSLIVLSILPDASISPLGEKLRLFTISRCPERVLITLPVLTFHSLIVLSMLPDASTAPLPLGENTTLHTSFSWPTKVLISLPDLTSHSLIVLSLLPVAKVLPLGEKAKLITDPPLDAKEGSCPTGCGSCFSVSIFHSVTVR